jgi:hypothetical protein
VKEKLQEYALIAEIVGGIAIVASLLFVGLQIQQNTAVAKVSSYQQNIEEISDWRTLIITDVELLRLFNLYTNEEELSADPDRKDATRLIMLMANYFGTIENAFYAKEYGLLGETEWDRFKISACEHYNRMERTKVGINFITDDFRSYLETEC